MTEVHGHKIYAPFIFVCNGKVYSSHSGTRWSVNFMHYGIKAWGNTTRAEQDVTRACPDGRNSEVNAAFRKASKGHFRLKDNQIASFLKQQSSLAKRTSDLSKFNDEAQKLTGATRAEYIEISNGFRMGCNQN